MANIVGFQFLINKIRWRCANVFKFSKKFEENAQGAHNAWLGVWHAQILKRLWIVSMVGMSGRS